MEGPKAILIKRRRLAVGQRKITQDSNLERRRDK